MCLLRFDESHGEITTPFVATQFVYRLVAVGISTADVVGPSKIRSFKAVGRVEVLQSSKPKGSSGGAIVCSANLSRSTSRRSGSWKAAAIIDADDVKQIFRLKAVLILPDPVQGCDQRRRISALRTHRTSPKGMDLASV